MPNLVVGSRSRGYLVTAQLTVVTAASSNHYGALCQMLASLRRLGARVECYDIGLTPAESLALPRWDGIVHRRFAYDQYPPHMNADINAGEYAWKPVIIADVVERSRAQDSPSNVLWADAGCYFDSIASISDRIASSGGLWVRASAGTMRQWTHPLMFEYLKADPQAYGDKPNADATLVGFGIGSGTPADREAVYQNIVAPWKAYAMIKDCIAPRGSSRTNHRQDQSVLSYLVHRAQYRLVDDTRRDLGVRCKCDRWFYHYVGFNVPPCIYARTCLA
jgi:hypothetical protein